MNKFLLYVCYVSEIVLDIRPRQVKLKAAKE